MAEELSECEGVEVPEGLPNGAPQAVIDAIMGLKEENEEDEDNRPCQCMANGAENEAHC